MAGTTAGEDAAPRPQMDEALRRIADCRAKADGVLDLGGLGLDDGSLATLMPEIEQLPPLLILYLGLAPSLRGKPPYMLKDEDKRECNTVRTLPTHLIAAHPQLQQLDLAYNRLGVLPESVGQLTALQSLDLQNNQLTMLPGAIGRLTALQSLNLQNNHLTALPEAFGRLTALNSLKLENNQLVALPETFGRLRELQSLYLENNRLAALPETFDRLAALQTLWLNGNQLTLFPKTICRLTALQSLYLHNNQLVALPETVGELTALEYLSFSSNQLTTFPEAICQLTKLKDLFLYNNRLSTLSEKIGRLTALTALYLRNNELTALPEAFGRLAALKSLDLQRNRLAELPEAFGRLSALESLKLENNQLTALPEAFGNLTALQRLFLDGNPIAFPPPEFLSQEPKAIVEFLARVRANGRPLHEAKVVLVGDPAHGKTALRSWLQFGKFIKPEESTRGGEIGWRDLVVAEQKGRANIWDFGGQDRYRPTQQPLFTPGALYLLVCKGRGNLNEAGVPEWLRLIQLRAGRNARVLLVATHMGTHDAPPSLAPLKDDLRDMIKGVYCVDSPTGFGVKALLERVWSDVVELPGFRHKWPAGYIDARDKVLGLRSDGDGKPLKPFIPYTEFLRICRPHEIADFAARSLATAMSMQGRLDYKGTEADPNQLVILDPEWLLKAIAYVIDDAQVKASGGILHRRDLARIWRDHGRPESDKPFKFEEHVWPHLLGLLAAHEIVYRLGDDEWVVPQLVTDLPPDIPWKDAAAGAIRRNCELDYPIPGLMAVLTVRHHYKHVNRRLFWQRGAFLRHPHSGAEGLVTVDGEQSIRLETRGLGADSLMADLKASVERLVHERWPGTAGDAVPPYRFLVPCPTPGCQGHYPLRDLEADLHQKRSEAACVGGGRHTHAIGKLLYQIEESNAVAEIRRADLGSQTYGQPPRFVEISPVNEQTLRGRAKGAIKRRVRIQIYCELSEKPVDGAVDVVEVDKKSWEAAKRWAPWVVRGAIVFGGGIGVPMPTDDPSDVPSSGDRKKSDAGDEQLLNLPIGKLVRPDGQILPSELADKLIAIANKGNMRQTRVSTGRWVWASPDEADRNDPTVPKERG
jgi:internalin A